MHGLESGGNVADFPGTQSLDGFHTGGEDPDLDRFHIHFGGEHAQDIVGLERAFDDTDVGNDALVRVVMRIEDERAERDIVRIFGRRNACDDGFENLIDVESIFGRDLKNI